jgi:hypothetical protein
LLRAVRLSLLLCGLASCTAEPSCVDGLGRPCASNAECDDGDTCRELVGRGFFCTAPDGSGTQVLNGQVSTVPVSSGLTEDGVEVRAGRFRALPRAIGSTEDGITVIEGDLR